MAKKKKSSIFYHLRVTEHKDLKGERDYEHRKIKKFRVTKKRLHIVKYDPTNPSIILEDYHTTVKAYRTRYNEGNVIRWSTSYYVKNPHEIEALIRKSVSENKKTRRTDISAIAQLIQGGVTNKWRSYLKKGSFISTTAKFVNVKRTASTVKKQNKESDFKRHLSRLELDYRIGSQSAGRKRRKRQAVIASERPSEAGRLKLRYEEKEAIEARGFKPRKVKKSEKLQKRRMMQRRKSKKRKK